MPDQYDLGILFVHGIGAQQRGDTLLQFGEPLVQSMVDWLGEKSVVLHGTELVGAPAHSYATVIPNGVPRRLVVAESWWAETFHPPRWWPMAAWLLSAVPFVLFRGLDHRVGLIATHKRIDCQKRKRGARAFCLWLLLELVRLAKNLASSLLVVLASLVVALLGIVAIVPPVRRYILSVQTLMIRYIGDSYALLVGAGGGDAMVSQVERDLAWLEGQSVKEVVIVAHSQGAEIVHRVLARRPAGRPIASLITLGQGIAKLRAVRLMHAKRTRAQSAYVLRLLAAVLTVLPLPLALRFGWILAFAAVLALPLAAVLIGSGRKILQGIVLDDEAFARELRQGIDVGKVRCWRDYFATSDPVPEGKLPVTALGLDHATSCQMVNLRSPFLDHTSYWQNAEGFRPAVLQGLAGELGWPFSRVLTDRVTRGQETRARLTHVLVGAAWGAVAVAVIVSVPGLLGAGWFGLWDGVGGWVGPAMAWVAGLFNHDVHDWLNHSGKDAATAAFVVFVCAATYALVDVVWQQRATKRGARVLRD